jgi:hypothetical protein
MTGTKDCGVEWLKRLGMQSFESFERDGVNRSGAVPRQAVSGLEVIVGSFGLLAPAPHDDRDNAEDGENAGDQLHSFLAHAHPPRTAKTDPATATNPSFAG